MRFEYGFDLTIDMGKAIDSVGALMSTVNDHMSNMGFDDKLSVHSAVSPMTLSSNRELSPKEIEHARSILEEQLAAKWPGEGIRVEFTGCKSGNVSQ